MKTRQWIIAIILLLLVGATFVAFLATRVPTSATEETAPPAGKGLLAREAPAPAHSLVDQRPLETARRMAAMAGAQDEQVLAHQALNVADHEVDLAFLDTLRTVEQNPPPLSPQAKQIAERKKKAAAAIEEDKDNVGQLTRKLASAPESQKDNLQDQIDVTKAQMDLDQDELDDASGELEQAGGDPQAKIKRLQEEHEAGDHNAPAVGSSVNPHEGEYESRTLLGAFQAWRALREKQSQLEAAREETAAKQQFLSKKHEELAAQVEKDKENREAARQQAKGFSTSAKNSSRDESKAAAKSALDSLRQYTLDQRNLADRGRRLQDEQDLNDIYANWIALVASREIQALHRMYESLLWILLIVLVVYLADRLIEHLFTGISAENKRIDTLRTVVKFTAQAAGAIAIIFVIFGMPTQTTTVLGLAGAGLTVAMKDFIVAFFGWFVLMGRNGIRVGDWVEIGGVSGEVVEVGLLKTVLLETGNWTDSSHPTGRRVSFVNSFAIEGHFFNFTTSGQWMWDELQVQVPSGEDPYPIIDGIQKLVEKETSENAKNAEAEWQQAGARYKARAVSATPGINIVPTGSGVQIKVRYITRAYERHETRNRLNEAVVELMHGRAVRA
jgi:small-conductance mechanosensitive channel